MAANLDWVKEIEIKDLLEGDAKLIAVQCGIETLIKLWENLGSLSLYISGKPLMDAKKRYIKKFYTGSNVKQLAIKLDCSEKFVYEVIKNGR